jgi:hypothetical protein
VKERPILFSGPMVRAILDGRKTQTRRVAKHPLFLEAKRVCSYKQQSEFDLIFEDDSGAIVLCPYGKPGDRLWVRETFFPVHTVKHEPKFAAVIPEILYRADYEDREPDRSVIAPHHWKPSIFMTPALSRITLEVVSVRVERLQDISEADAIAEGVEQVGGGRYWLGAPGLVPSGTAAQAYYELWESINGAGSWPKNPWVWVVEFQLVKGAKAA